MSRHELYSHLLEDLSGTYVEIGTCWGGFAEFLLLHTPVQKLFCVDPYKLFPQHTYYDALNFTTQEFLDKKFCMVEKRLTYNNLLKPVCMVRSTSYEAAQKMPDNLSFVYIDANHHNKDVIRDLVLWWAKIKPGGILAGDDVEDIHEPHTDGDLFIQRDGSFGVYGVATALRDFAKVCPDFHYLVVGNQFWARKPIQTSQ